MAHTVSGKLRKAPFIKEGCGPQQDSTMFVIELSEMVKDWQTQEKHYTNYSAMFFAKSQGALELYRKVFVEGSFVVVSSEKLKTDVQQGQDGRTFVTMKMENPRLESFLALSEMGQPQQQGWGQPQQPNNGQPYQQPASQPQRHINQPQSQGGPQYNAPPADFDDD